MVTYFNTKDMVSFGNYLMEQIRSGKKEAFPDEKFYVTHADIENWKHEMSLKKDN